MSTPGAINIMAADGSKLIAKESIPIWCTATSYNDTTIKLTPAARNGTQGLIFPSYNNKNDSHFPWLVNGMTFRFIVPNTCDDKELRYVCIAYNLGTSNSISIAFNYDTFGWSGNPQIRKGRNGYSLKIKAGMLISLTYTYDDYSPDSFPLNASQVSGSGFMYVDNITVHQLTAPLYTGTDIDRRKLYLVGIDSQSTSGGDTYSNSEVYMRNGYVTATGFYGAPLMTKNFQFDASAKWYKLFTFTRRGQEYNSGACGGFDFSIWQTGYNGTMRADFRISWNYYLPYYTNSSTTYSLKVQCKNVEYHNTNGYINSSYFTTSNICDQSSLSTPGIKVEAISISTAGATAEYAVWYGGTASSSTGLYKSRGVCTITNYTYDINANYGLKTLNVSTETSDASTLAISTLCLGSNASGNNIGAYVTVQQPDNSVSNYTVFQNGAGNTSSDVRFKKDVAPTEDVLPVLKDLNIINYVWKKDGEPEWDTVGVSAQELEEHGGVWSKLVHKRSDADETRFLDYDRFGVLACKAIQEQQETIETQQKTIRVLEHRLEVLEKKIMSE